MITSRMKDLQPFCPKKALLHNCLLLYKLSSSNDDVYQYTLTASRTTIRILLTHTQTQPITVNVANSLVLKFLLNICLYTFLSSNVDVYHYTYTASGLQFWFCLHLHTHSQSLYVSFIVGFYSSFWKYIFHIVRLSIY